MTRSPEALWIAILFLAAVSYGLRAGGFVLARWVEPESFAGRLLQRAPGNLYIAFITVGVATGGWPTGLGVAAALGMALLVRNELVVLLAGAGAVALVTWMQGA